MKDYYSILRLPRDASSALVRKAYRQLAKEYHPDLNDGENPEEHFILLREAYEILIDEGTREQYDRAYNSFFGVQEFNYREFLKSRMWDKESQAKLICYDLLHDLESEALEVYEEAFFGEVEEIRSYLEREDFMDYTFIIAEEYVHRGMPVKAFQILRTIALEEERKPYFKHFYPEVLILLWRIVRGPIEEDEDDALRLSMMKELSDLDYTDKDRARIYKAMAEIYLKRSDLYMAAQNYKGAEKSYPKLPGMSKLKRKVEAFLQE
ncbi:DnaJ domain-containing protein [Marispirochaeta aestuarii]|uniref:DnaJ domain-containing protein n=2 Tax=Marispirochaeta aestuarii TaxID=1963862 RepID=UPI001301E4F6|nr:DnaJ domain-containing protein [Marispirochaeta aestuarii]